MSSRCYDLHGMRLFECSTEGPALRSGRDASDVIGDAMAQSARVVVLPVGRLAPEFFQLRTGLAGEVIQKFVNYRLKLVIVGDFAEAASRSEALQAFIRESNRRDEVWFLGGMEELEERLERS